MKMLDAETGVRFRVGRISEAAVRVGKILKLELGSRTFLMPKI